MFLVINNIDNRIVCNVPDKPTLYHVGTIYEGLLYNNLVGGMSQPTRLCFTEFDDIINYVKNIDYLISPGIIGFTSQGQFKILNKKYQDYFLLRGNEPSINYRYLQLRMCPESSNNLSNLYPHKKNIFLEYENILKNIAIKLHSVYINRFIKKIYTVLPQEEFIIIKECHSMYINKIVSYVNLEVITLVLNKQSSNKLNHMIKKIKNLK